MRDRLPALRHELHSALHRASRRYHKLCRPGSLWLWGYAWSKYRLDPAYLQIAALIPPASLTLDLGSGLGLLPALLAEMGEARSAVALEWDRGKVEASQRVMAGTTSVRILRADVFESEFPACEVIVIMDVLHYFPERLQNALLEKAFRALRPGGRLILRETDARAGGGRGFTRSLEWLAIHCGWNRGPALHYRAQSEWVRSLDALGLGSVTVQPSSQVTPGNVLIHGIKDDSGQLAIPSLEEP